MAKAGNKARPHPEFVYVIAGDDQTLVNARCIELVDRLVSPQEKATGLLVADADKITVTEVLDELRTLPFLTKKRLVVLRNADKFISARGQQTDLGEPAGSTNREILEKYFESPCPTGVLVMTVSTWPNNTRLAKKLPDVGTLIEVKTPKGAEITRRLIDYARDAHNKPIEHGAAELLIELAGDNLPRLYTEIDKLATYAANEKSITTAHIESLVGHNRLFDAFTVIDACLQKKPAPAVERLRRMFADDKNADYTTVGAFAYHFRRLFTAKKMLDEGQSQYEVAGKARIWNNKEAQFALLKRLTLRQIGDYLQQLAETDYAIKRGQAQPRIAIEQFVMQLAAL